MQALLSEPRTALDPALVAEALSLRRGAVVRHGAEVLTTGDAPTGELLRFNPAGSSVTWSYRPVDRVVGQSDSGLAAVRRRATLQLVGNTPVNLLGTRLRLYTEWMLTDRTWARFYLGVFVVVNPGALRDDGVTVRRTLELADKSYLWANLPIDGPLHIGQGTVAMTYVRDRLAERFGETRFALPASTTQVSQGGGPGLLFEAGTTWLQVLSAVLEHIGYDQLTADELGRPTTTALGTLAARAPEHAYAANLGKVVEAGQVEPLLPTLPNIVRFSARQGPSLGNVEGNGLRTVLNQSTGPASIDSRGGLQVVLQVDVDADTQAALDAVAAADAQRYFAGGGLRWTGQVGLNPLHSDRDVIALELPRLGLTGGSWLVTDWTYPLSDLSSEDGAVMAVIAERRVA